MAHYTPEAAFEALKSNVEKSIERQFPIEGKTKTLRVSKVWTDDTKNVDDIHSQKKARETGRTWSVPVRASIELVDNKTGKVKDRQTINVAHLPKTTNRYTYIVNGREHQPINQLTLKAGVYARRKQNGELISEWNVAKGSGFKVAFDPKSKKMAVNFSGTSSNHNMYPILKSMGATDKEIEEKWGKGVLEVNKAKVPTLKDEYKVLSKAFAAISPRSEVPTNLDDLRVAMRDEISKGQLVKDATKETLGKAYGNVSKGAMLAGTGKVLQLSRGEVEPDNRDSLKFKDINSLEDFLGERIDKKSWGIKRKVVGTLNKERAGEMSVRQLISPDTFGGQIKDFFTKSDLSDTPTQLNPMTYIAGNRKTTIMGEGGISSTHMVMTEAKQIDNSHLGFLDPIQTPESSKTGTVLQMASSSRKQGKKMLTSVYNLKTKKQEWLDPSAMQDAVVAFPDQYERDDKGAPIKPVSLREVKVSGAGGHTVTMPANKVEYVVSSPRGLFDLNSNLIPFLQNNQGNRTMVAAKMLEQAVPLKHREAPNVQVGTDKPGSTFESTIGKLNSHHSKVDGKVIKVTGDTITLRDNKGERKAVQLYDHFPMNDDRSFMHSTPLVKVGDSVKRGQVLADTNFTKKGVSAIGTNLNVGYMPFKGYNFEDGIVISESAAKKLTSEHMLRSEVEESENTLLDKKKFVAYSAGKYTKGQIDNLDDRGVVKVGAEVNPGDVLIGSMKKVTHRPEDLALGRISKKALRPLRPAASTWEKDVPGKVVSVVTSGGKTTVNVRADFPAVLGDKIVGRHANKGIITKIIADNEMPADKDGGHVEVLLNPAGVPSRINLGQVLETSAAKLAKKTGKPYIVKNFDPKNKDYTRSLIKEMKASGVSDTEDLKDPVTGKVFKDVLTGSQYIYKLHHSIDKKLAYRSRDKYDSNLSPAKGGSSSGQAMDMMGMYSLLAHNARENIHEFQGPKSEMNDDYWNHIIDGSSPPTPKVPFTFEKFGGYMKAMGVDINKDGNDLVLSPMTDKKVLEMSNGEITDPGATIRSSDLRPAPGGIFDPRVTGTDAKNPVGNLGTKWGHITLANRLPNPTFEKPIKSLLGIGTTEFNKIMKGSQTLNGDTGPTAITNALKKVDIKSARASLEGLVKVQKGSKLDASVKKLKYLRALEKGKLSASEAYTMKQMPVLPPVMRPFALMDDGSISWDDTSKLYNRIGNTNKQLKEFDWKIMPDENGHELQNELYDGVKSFMHTGATSKGRHFRSVYRKISPEGGAKEGYFQKKVMGKKQDLSMRSTIIPEPSLSLDEVGVPRKAAREIYAPFVTRRLKRMGISPLVAMKKIRENDPVAERALELEVHERPMILKRDPVLHKFGVQAFRPKLVSGKAIRIHPLITGGFNADFDGDTMSAFLPVSDEAVKEARRMMPSNNLFSPSTGDIAYAPTQEAMLGLYQMSEVSKKKATTFKTTGDMIKAVRKGTISYNDPVHILSKSSGKLKEKLAAAKKVTTVGRMILNDALPSSLKSDELLYDRNYRLKKSQVKGILTDVGRSSHNFSSVADEFKDMGNNFVTGSSISLTDFLSDETKAPIFAKAKKKEREIRARYKNVDKVNEEVVNLYQGVSKELDSVGQNSVAKKDNRMYDWIRSGARGNWGQFKQMVLSPVLVADNSGKPVPVPIDKSYSEGLDVGSYFTSMHGARMGTISRAEGTWKPGSMSKQMMRVSIDKLVTAKDCGTHDGVTMNASSKQVLGRYLAKGVNLGKGKGSIRGGSLVDSSVMTRFINNKVGSVYVRSPLKCKSENGVCAKCYGQNEMGELYSTGANIGVISAQALGEPLTQLAMNSFHSGGSVGAKGTDSLSTFDRMEQLLSSPKVLPGQATLAEGTGVVGAIIKDKDAGGWNVSVGAKKHYVPGNRKLSVAKGSKVKIGDSLSSGPKNPRRLLELQGIDSVQQYLTNEMEKVYGGNSGSLQKRNTEMFVRNITNNSVINESGDHPYFLPGDKTQTSIVQEWNRNLKKGQTPIKAKPYLQSVDLLPTELSEDWLARMNTQRLSETIADGAAGNWRSNIHGTHPVPAMAYAAEFNRPGAKPKKSFEF